MEEYETFCKKHLARIQGEFMENGMSPIVERRNVSLIRFNGVPVLSPLVSWLNHVHGKKLMTKLE
uniref:Uncharacterized protein n=1 Tax=Naja naja TaxID=35670 RepID=A0A8C6XTP7_NAJNA